MIIYIPTPLDDCEPKVVRLIDGLRRAGARVHLRILPPGSPLPVCEQCLAPLSSPCVRCGAEACGSCDLCRGCDQVVCEACNAPGVTPFAFPGDQHAHPHNI